MKKLVAILLVLISLSVFAQEEAVDELLSLPADEAGISYETDADDAMYYDDSGDSYYDED